MLRFVSVGMAVAALSSCATPPTNASWEQLAALGPILTVGEVNARSAELQGKKIILDAYISHVRQFYMLSSQKTEECFGKAGPAWGLPNGDGQMPLWFESNQVPFYARQFSIQRVVLSATLSGEITNEPSRRGQEKAHVQILEPMRGPLTSVKILRVFDGVCGS